MANNAVAGSSWWSNSIVRKARMALSAGMSTKTTSAFVVWIRRTKGSFAATGKLTWVYTARATLVPSTNTCITARCSLSAATIITESSGITTLLLPQILYRQLLCTQNHSIPMCRLSFAASGWLLGGVKLIFVEERLRILRSSRRLGTGCDAMHRAQHHQFRIALLHILALEQIANNRKVGESRKFVGNLSHSVVHETGDHEALTVLQFKLRVCAPRAQGRNVKSGDG